MSQLLKTTKFNIQERSRQEIAQRVVLPWRLKAKATVFRFQTSPLLPFIFMGWEATLALIKMQIWIIGCPKITQEVFPPYSLMCHFLLLLLSTKTLWIAITHWNPQIRCRIWSGAISKWSPSRMADKVLIPCCNLRPKCFRKAPNLISICKMLATKCKSAGAWMIPAAVRPSLPLVSLLSLPAAPKATSCNKIAAEQVRLARMTFNSECQIMPKMLEGPITWLDSTIPLREGPVWPKITWSRMLIAAKR